MERKRIVGIVQVYSKRSRDQMSIILKNFLNRANVFECESQIFSCIDELVKNAVKANYKFVLILDKLKKQIKSKNSALSDDELNNKVNEIIKDKKLYDETARNIAEAEAVSDTVRQILNEESVQLKLKNKVYNENRPYSEEELNQLEKLIQLKNMRDELERLDVKIILKIELENNFIFIEVTNTAPILGVDIQRIHSKRDEFGSYLGTGREFEFFMHNLDTSESGFGLGYATIDSFLYDIGLDPHKTIQILAASDTTIILSLPIDELQKHKAS